MHRYEKEFVHREDEGGKGGKGKIQLELRQYKNDSMD